MNARSMARRAPGLAAGLIIVALAVGGCENRGAVTGTELTTDVAKIPDVTDETGRTRSYLYDANNPFTATTLARLLKRDDVDGMVAAFEGRGMELSPQDCLVIEGVDARGVTQVTFIGLTHQDPGMEELGVLACFERGERVVISPAVFTSTPSRSGHHLKLAEGVWMDAGPMTLVDPASEETTRWEPDQWSKFWECALTYAPGPVTACFVGCMFVGPGYLQCAVACVATQSLSVVVRCATKVLMGGSLGGYDRRVE